jgi:hypothetical protein
LSVFAFKRHLLSSYETVVAPKILSKIKLNYILDG